MPEMMAALWWLLGAVAVCCVLWIVGQVYQLGYHDGYAEGRMRGPR